MQKPLFKLKQNKQNNNYKCLVNIIQLLFFFRLFCARVSKKSHWAQRCYHSFWTKSFGKDVHLITYYVCIFDVTRPIKQTKTLLARILAAKVFYLLVSSHVYNRIPFCTHTLKKYSAYMFPLVYKSFRPSANCVPCKSNSITVIKLYRHVDHHMKLCTLVFVFGHTHLHQS